jgi:hypothetical protein
MKKKMIYLIWANIKPFVFKLPLYFILYFILHYFSSFFHINELIVESSGFMCFFIFFFRRFFFYECGRLYKYLFEIFIFTSFYRKMFKYYSKIRYKSYYNEEPLRFFYLCLKIPKTSYKDIDKHSLEFIKKSLKLEREIYLIDKELKKKENLKNFDLMTKINVKMGELIEIRKKHEEDTKNF